MGVYSLDLGTSSLFMSPYPPLHILASVVDLGFSKSHLARAYFEDIDVIYHCGDPNTHHLP
jgi:hypothetical protein